MPTSQVSYRDRPLLLSVSCSRGTRDPVGLLNRHEIAEHPRSGFTHQRCGTGTPTLACVFFEILGRRRTRITIFWIGPCPAARERAFRNRWKKTHKDNVIFLIEPCLAARERVRVDMWGALGLCVPRGAPAA